MKLYVAVSASLLTATLSFGQASVDRSAINAGGADYAGAGFGISYSIGEVFTQTLEQPTIVLTEGFQQPLDSASENGVREMMVDDITLRAFPNPTGSAVTLQILNRSSGVRGLEALEVMSMRGDVLSRIAVDRSAERVDVDFRTLESGTYFLKVCGQHGTRALRVVKMK